MNPSANTNEQQGDPSWSTENWENPGAVGGLDQSANQYSGANRLEWEWDPMILAQHPGGGGSTDGPGGDGDRLLKNQISGGTMPSLRVPYPNISDMLTAGLPSNFTNNHMGIFSSAAIRNYGSLDGSAQLSSSSNLHSVLGASGIPGLAATSGTGIDHDIRSYDQRRREFFAPGMHDNHVKREEINDGHTRIGLNLGVRTYFSTEETAANRLGKRHRAGSPGSQAPMCQAEGCKADLSTAKQYHRRHKVCELHSKAPNVVAGGQTQRFCQQCSRFHSLGEFDDGKRSCRKRLADHNRRRRKPQPNAATTGGCAAESIGLKSADDDPSDSKSMLMPLKSRSSPSSVSLEDSDEKPGSVGNNLQLRPTGHGYGRGLSDDQHPSAHSGMINSQALAGSEAQALLSALSPASGLMIQNPRRQMTMMGGTGSHGHDHSVYQHLQGVQAVSTGQTGPNLSLSSLGGQLGVSHHGGRSGAMSGQHYNGMEPPAAPWMKPSLSSRSESLTQVVGRQGMNLQHLMSTESKSGITNSASANSSNSQEHDVQAYSPSSQNLIPRDMASPEWMLGSMAAGGGTPRSGSNQFGTSSMSHTMSGNGQLESGHQIMSLIESSPNGGQGGGNPGDGVSNQSGEAGGGGQGAVEFMQQHNSGADSGGENNSRGGGSTVDSPDMKYSELHAMRPYGGSSSASIYDSHHNILSGSFSYETMA